jgi:tRNA (guanine37-N1)-methyltransferase
MKFHFLTIFPEMINAYTGEAMLKRAKEKKLADFVAVNIRDYSKDKHGKTDDRPYGGGPGMVMTAEPILRAYSKLKTKKDGKVKVIQLSPSGKMFTNVIAKKMAKSYTDLVFICGRYEGVDDRVRKILKADEYSIGDYVLTGGELPSLVMTDAIVRQIKGVLGDQESLEEARVASPRVYTRPEVLVFKDKKHKVPKVLTEGNHKKIEEWRAKQKGL